MIASATTLALCVELYLKALRILVGLKATTDHDLWALYTGLPKSLTESIERQYEALGPPKGADIHTLKVKISVGPFREEQLAEAERKDAGRAQDNSLKSVPKRSKDAFLTWRYLHERGDPDQINRFSYEFHYLGNAAEAMRSHAVTLFSIGRSTSPASRDSAAKHTPAVADGASVIR